MSSFCHPFVIHFDVLMADRSKELRQTAEYKNLAKRNLALAKQRWPGQIDEYAIQALRDLTSAHQFSVLAGDLHLFTSGWYVTHTGLIRLARRKHCAGIHVCALRDFSDPTQKRWVFRATIYTRKGGPRFIGYGDADPSNVSQAVQGCEMRIAETRAVDRALRKAYGIGICSVEELGTSVSVSGNSQRMPPQSDSGNTDYGSPKVRDRLCQLIRQHRLDAHLVKSYAVDFCGTNTLRESTREQVEAFVAHLSDWAEKDRNALLCQLNSYLPVQSDRKNESEAAQEKAGAA
jgi:hypothetical protein